MLKLFIVFCILHLYDCGEIYSHGINLDCDYYSIGLANVYHPITIVNDELKHRNFPTALYINGNLIKTGWHALEMLSGDPQNVYMHLPCLIGEDEDSVAVKHYMTDFPYHRIMRDNLTGEFVIKNLQGKQYKIIDLVSILLQEMIELSENHKMDYSFEQPINFNPRTLVLTVPSPYTQLQRELLFRICKNANLTLLKIIEPSKVALNSLSSFKVTQQNTGVYGILYIGYNHMEMTIADFQEYQRFNKQNGYKTMKIKVLTRKYIRNNGFLSVFKSIKNHFVEKLKLDLHKMLKRERIHKLGHFYRAVYGFIEKLIHSPYAETEVYNMKNNHKMDKLSLTTSELKELMSKGPFLPDLYELIRTTISSIPKFWIVPKEIYMIGNQINLPYITNSVKSRFRKHKFSLLFDQIASVTWSSALETTRSVPGLQIVTPKLQENTIETILIKLHNKGKTITNKPEIKWKNNKRFFSAHFDIKSSSFYFVLFYLPMAKSAKEFSRTFNQKFLKLHKVVVTQTKDSQCLITESETDDLCHNKGITITYSIDHNDIINLETTEAIFVKEKSFNDSTDKINLLSTIVSNNRAYVLVKIPYVIQIIDSSLISERQKESNNERSRMFIENVNLAKKKEEARNELYLHVLEYMNNINTESYLMYMSALEKDTIWKYLNATYKWLHESNHSQTIIKDYIIRLDELINITAKVDNRVHEKKYLPFLEKRLKALLASTQKFILNMMFSSSDGKDSKHWFTRNETDDLRKLNKELMVWHTNYTEKSKNLKPYEDVIVSTEVMIEKIEILEKQQSFLINLWNTRIKKKMEPENNYIENKRDNGTLECNSTDANCQNYETDRELEGQFDNRGIYCDTASNKTCSLCKSASTTFLRLIEKKRKKTLQKVSHQIELLPEI